MTTAGQPTAFSELYGDLLNRMRADTTSSGAAETIAKRYINIALHDIHIQQNWPWAEREGTIITRPPYSTGSVSVQASARTTLEGTNTAWSTAVSGMGFNNMNDGGKFKLSGSAEVYRIATVSSTISATLSSRIVDEVDTASTYAVAYSGYITYQDEYALAEDFFRLIDARQFSDVMNIPVLGSQDFYRRYPRNSTHSGPPEKATIIALGPGVGDSATYTDERLRVVFFPYPDRAYPIPYRYITKYLAVDTGGNGKTEMTADTDVPIIPGRYRHVLLSYASSIWYRDQKDDTRAGEAYQEYVDGVKRVAGDSAPQRDRPRMIARHMRNQPVYARGRGSRYSTNADAWDSFRE